MNILHVDEQKAWRGGEQQAEYLIRHLVAEGHPCVVAGPEGRPFVARDFGVAVGRETVACRGEWDLASARRLARIIRERAIDIVHAHTSHAHTLACLARKFAGRSHVVVSRRVSVTPKSGMFNRFKYRMPDAYVAISQSAASGLTGVSVPDDKVFVVHSGIDLARLDVDPIARSELGVAGDVVLLGAVGALVPIKDHKTLLDAVAVARDAVPRMHLVVAGEGECRADLERQIAALDLGEHVTLLGQRNDVPQILCALDIFVVSSVSEGLGSSILDAMGCGVPVVGTTAGGIPEVVVDGETGLLCAPGDAKAMAAAILALATDAGRRGALGQKGRARVESMFTSEAMAAGNLAVYERLAGHASS